MIADINESGRISVKTETEAESELLRSWLRENVKLTKAFESCCNNRKCAFKFDLKDRMFDMTCTVCGKKFTGTIKVDVCPSCYV